MPQWTPSKCKWCGEWSRHWSDSISYSFRRFSLLAVESELHSAEESRFNARLGAAWLKVRCQFRRRECFLLDAAFVSLLLFIICVILWNGKLSGLQLIKQNNFILKNENMSGWHHRKKNDKIKFSKLKQFSKVDQVIMERSSSHPLHYLRKAFVGSYVRIEEFSLGLKNHLVPFRDSIYPYK